MGPAAGDVDAARFAVVGVVIPLTTVLCLPAVNTRTIAEARAAAGLDPGP